MSTIKTMTLDELKNQTLTAEDLEILNNANAEPTEDCPALTEEELKEMKPWYIAHPDHDLYKITPKKKQISIRIDLDLLEWLKKDGAGYQSRLNDVLRWAKLQKCPLIQK